MTIDRINDAREALARFDADTRDIIARRLAGKRKSAPMNRFLSGAEGYLRSALARVAELEAERNTTPPAGWARTFEPESDEDGNHITLWRHVGEDFSRFVGMDEEDGWWWASHFGPKPSTHNARRPVVGRATTEHEAMRAADAAGETR